MNDNLEILVKSIRRIPAELEDLLTGDLPGFNETEEEYNEIMESLDKAKLREFDSFSDWLMTLVYTGIKGARPDLNSDEIIAIAQILSRQIALPDSTHLWMKIKTSTERYGMQSIISKIRREYGNMLRNEER
jgi:hypothetical protein